MCKETRHIRFANIYCIGIVYEHEPTDRKCTYHPCMGNIYIIVLLEPE